MREILFKAKGQTDEKWHIGFLAVMYGGICIIRENEHEWICQVDTLCQYTGLTDKNGKKIWENDVVEFEDVGEEGYEYKEGFDFTNRARVEFAEGRWSLTDFAEENSGVIDEMYNHDEFMGLWRYCEVIGNIFDNPDLVEGGAE